MKLSRKIAIGAAAALGLAAGVVIAHPGQMGGGMGMHGQMAGMGHGPMGAGAAAAQQLMTPEEQAAFREKMQSAKSAEERRQIAEANRTEMQKRAQEKGITLPEPHGPRAGFGRHGGPAAK
jgi:Spy/CpxP family protein refolding chaperone